MAMLASKRRKNMIKSLNALLEFVINWARTKTIMMRFRIG